MTNDRVVCHLLDCFERLSKIGDQILCTFDAAGEPDQIRADARCFQFFIAHLAMRGVRGMQHAGACIGNMRGDLRQLERRHEALGCFAPASNTEAHYATRSIRQVLLSELIALIAG